jgi:U3 small nucleolar RNA-associated protein 20
VKSADQFSVIGDVLVRELKQAVNEQTIDNREKLRRTLEVASVPYSVRLGSRMTRMYRFCIFEVVDQPYYLLETHHTIIFALLNTLPLDDRSLHPALLRFISALFISSDASMWLGPGLRFLQHAWSFPSPASSVSVSSTLSTTEFTLRLHGILADLNWGGWKLVALPVLLKATRKPETFNADPRLLVDFLAGLVRARKLGVEDVDLVWKENYERWIIERLRFLEKAIQASDAAVSFQVSALITLLLRRYINQGY